MTPAERAAIEAHHAQIRESQGYPAKDYAEIAADLERRELVLELPDRERVGLFVDGVW